MLASALYKNQRYCVLFILIIIAVGISSFRSIARQEDPSITNFIATATTFFPGATPERVEALVTRPLEDQLRRIPEIDELRSTSSAGVSFINITLHETLAKSDIARAWSEIRDALGDAQSQFPSGVGAPVFDDDRLSAYTRIYGLRAAKGHDISLSLLNRLAQDFADAARNVSGTERVDLYGEPEEEVRVSVNEAALAARGLSLSHLAQALSAADPKVSAGRSSGSGSELLVEIGGEFDSLARIRKAIVATNEDGNTVTVADIAKVYKTSSSPPPAMALINGQPGILIGIAMSDGLQVDVWSKNFADFADQWQASAPQAVSLESTYDQSVYTQERLKEVAQNLLLGVVLVLLVLLFTLGWRAAIVVAVILPLCALMSITLLYYWGVALHQMSVTGMVVALGLLVDGSIVMTDEVRKRLQRGLTPLAAITTAVTRLRIPLLSSTATTILAFMPMVVLPGPSGDFMGTIAKSVVVMLASSLLLALTITPVLAAWLLPAGLRWDSHWWERGAEGGRPSRLLQDSLDWTLAHPAAGIALALVLPLSGFLSFGTLTAQFFPSTDRDQLYIQVKLPDGRSIYDSQALVTKLDQKLRAEALVKRVDWTLGESPPAFYYNMYRMKEGIPSWAEALVMTQDARQTDDLIRRLQQEVDRDYPEARIIVRGIDQGPPVMAPLEVEIYGPNLDRLRHLGEQFRQRMERVPDVTHTNASLSGGAPKLLFQVDESQAQLAGLQLTSVADTLDASLRGLHAGELLEDTQRLPVRVRLEEQRWSNAEDIGNIRISSATSTAGALPFGTPLSALGKVTLRPSSSPISRKNGERVNTVQAYLTRGVLPEEALKFLRADLAEDPIALPDGYRISFGGDSDVRADVMDHIMAPIGMILAALLATIVLTFNSWRLSAVAMLVCLCSLGLSLLALAIFRYPFGIQAVIGVIGSIGVSINAAIIIMTALQLEPRAMRGELLAVRQVVMDSSRHIVSTTITTFGGFLPLILEDSLFWPPFAMAIAGGVLLSTIVSFFLVPPLFVVLNRLRWKASRGVFLKVLSA
ncbi:efflux RND transporter permease subunit [Parahaliea sp. F7430]|uniref:Efflux RND transporter permease subunit n=1 Tax=Sediminihaliea albiluteola TaxID=2758564 RepID=A0A7W2YIZ3_9GAMM|nr:efflux RND transporter permease subunit [Sediminihaliea albiluteola]MBA6412084.1 efflux RND transporter permease subunit [Sediminihaliea albiluteola]